MTSAQEWSIISFLKGLSDVVGSKSQEEQTLFPSWRWTRFLSVLHSDPLKTNHATHTLAHKEHWKSNVPQLHLTKWLGSPPGVLCCDWIVVPAFLEVCVCVCKCTNTGISHVNRADPHRPSVPESSFGGFFSCKTHLADQLILIKYW